MGDLVRKVNLAPLSTEGDVSGKVRTWNALIDTGATVTIVPRSFLKRWDCVKGLPVRLGRGLYPTVILAVCLDGPNCRPHVLSVAVSTRHASKALPHAEMILGHDYLQRERGLIAYTDEGHQVGCIPYRRRKHRFE